LKTALLSGGPHVLRKFAVPFFIAAALAAPLAGQLATPSTIPISAPSSRLPEVVPSNRPAIGIALEGGGAMGLAHIGVLQWFEEHRIPIDRLSGTSMGSLVGGLYATGTTPAELRTFAISNAFLNVFTVQTSYANSSFRRRQDRHEMPQAITIGLRHGPSIRNALLSERGVNEFLTSNLFAYNFDDLDYNRTPIPFRCVATDLTSLSSVTFDSGPMPQSIRASISIPGVFPPVLDKRGHYLVDGGILDNLPTDVLKSDLHADVVIAVHLEDSPLAVGDTSSIVGVLNRAFSAGVVRNVEESKRRADLLISVQTGKFTTTDYDKAAEFIAAGYQAAEANRAALLHYALDDAGWEAYLADRESRRRARPGLVRQVKVEGGVPGAQREVLHDTKSLEGQAATPDRVLNTLTTIQSNGGLSAAYETFTPANAKQAGNAAEPDSGILVRLGKDPSGPPYLLFGLAMAAETSNINRAEFTLRFIDQNLGGFGSELRASARIGYQTDISAEYYRLLTPSGYFVQPSAGLVREPVYIWANQKRIAEHFHQNLVAGIEAGRTFSNQLQVSASWQAESTHWSPIAGTEGGPYLSGTAQTGLLHFHFDAASSGTISPNGLRIDTAMGALYHGADSDNAPLLQLSINHTHAWKEKNIVALIGDVNSYLRANVAQPYRFTLGGPSHLAAASFDEFRGTDTAFVRAGYLRRIAALPTGLGQGLYFASAYEAGEVWSPEARAILRQDGIVGLMANTPLGVMTFGVSVGDAGHRKVFITLGRWF
jgi:NTE family protein